MTRSERTAATLFLCVLLLLQSRPAMAEDKDFSYTPEVSVPITLLGLSVWASGEWLKEDLVEGRDTRAWLNPVDEAVRLSLRWSPPHREDAHDMSNIGLGTIPVLAGCLLFFGSDDGLAAPSMSRARHAGIGALIMLESASVAMLANQVVKFAVLRNRPYTRSEDYAGNDPDGHLSFYSGHTTVAFSLAVAGATLHQMRGGNHPYVVWTAALTLALAVGYFRIAADKHYFTDVLVGALTGAAAGFLIPRYLHEARQKEEAENTKVRPMAVIPVISQDAWMLGFGFAF